MTAYYNENDAFAAAWLRNLIAAGLVAPGEVDERDIRDVRPGDLAGYAQCHFFAGIGVWSLALRLAGWPDERPVWTGSCPCQPFSAAGRRAGFDDERHLWPHWHHLIRECRPAVVFGEQVASKDGKAWIELVHADMEGSGYAFGAAVLPVAGVGAPHGRHRLWFVGHAADEPRERDAGAVLATQAGQHGTRSGEHGRVLVGPGDAGASVVSFILGDAFGAGLEVEREQHARGELAAAERAGAVGGPWRDAEWLRCRDEKWRPVEPGTFPLAHGVAGRVGKLRAYGNAISPWPAAEFIAAYLEARGEEALTLLDMLE